MRLRPIITALAFGVVMNYAAAWYCVWQFEEERAIYNAPGRWCPEPFTPGPLDRWPVNVPSDWPITPNSCMIRSALGVHQTDAYHHTRRDGQESPFYCASRTIAGWPASSTWMECTLSDSSPSVRRAMVSIPLTTDFELRRDLELPLGILPLGFAVNVTLYASVPWALGASFALLKRRRRARQHLCPTCAYPIGTSPLCTECGHPVQPIIPP